MRGTRCENADRRADDLRRRPEASPFAPGFRDTRRWGLGLAVATRPDETDASPGSYGWSGGIGTHVLIDPARNLVAMLMAQQLMRGPEDAALAIATFKLADAASSH